MNIIKPSISMSFKPHENSILETECLFGESVQILDNYLEWAYCKLLTDNYYGWVRKNGLGYLKPSTHRVLSKRSFLFNHRNAKSNCIHHLPIGAKLAVKIIKDDWAEVYLSDKHFYETAYVPSKHIVIMDNKVKDWVAIAEQLLGTPYKWGGRDTMGIDCSALIQLSCEAYGENIPRNTIDQLKTNKKIITNINNLNRGCVVFWEGHVSLMVDRLNCIHANAFHMKTVIEPLNEIIIRMGKQHSIIKMFNFN